MSARGYVAAAVLGAVVGGLAVGVPQGWRHDAQLASVQAEIERERRAHALAVADAQQDARNEEQRRIRELEVIEDETQRAIAAAVADERRAADVRVRDTAAEYAARYRAVAERATAAAEREAASTAIGMFAQLLAGTDDLAGVYAGHADRARIAGLACERAYDAVRAGQ